MRIKQSGQAKALIKIKIKNRFHQDSKMQNANTATKKVVRYFD